MQPAGQAVTQIVLRQKEQLSLSEGIRLILANPKDFGKREAFQGRIARHAEQLVAKRPLDFAALLRCTGVIP